MKKILFLIIFQLLFFSNVYAFSDESTFIWAKDAVNKWYAKGLVGGYEDGTFRGNANITRGELLSIVNRLNRSGEKISKRPANDVAEGAWFFNDVGVAIENGLVELDENGNFRPYDYATREETMVVLSNLFHLTYPRDAYTYLASNFSDVSLVKAENISKVAGVVDFGFVNGYPDGTLRPKRPVTRAEFVAMVNNCIAEIYDSGTYLKKIIPNSIIVNGSGVKLSGFEVRDKIFVMDGAKEEPPYIVNTNVGKGINSRIGDIEIRREDEWETVTEKEAEKEEKKYNDPLVAVIKYSETGWTNENVTVTIKLNDKDFDIVNNSGSTKHTFKQNGEFIFVCENSDGKIVKFLTEVDCIDKISPQIKATIEKSQTIATISVNVSDDGLSPIKKLRYVSGEASTTEALQGTDIGTGSFSVSGNGIYTIAALDEAGNDSKIRVTVSGLTGNNSEITPGQGTNPEDGTTTPGQGTTPGDGTTTPGQGTNPEDGTTTPGQGTNPDDGTTPPGQGTTPDDGTTLPEQGTDGEGDTEDPSNQDGSVRDTDSSTEDDDLTDSEPEVEDDALNGADEQQEDNT